MENISAATSAGILHQEYLPKFSLWPMALVNLSLKPVRWEPRLVTDTDRFTLLFTSRACNLQVMRNFLLRGPSYCEEDMIDRTLSALSYSISGDTGVSITLSVKSKIYSLYDHVTVDKRSRH